MINYIIPSDNWEQQHFPALSLHFINYIIPSDNWEQQLSQLKCTDDELGIAEGTIAELSSFIGKDMDIVKLVQIGKFRYISNIADELFKGYESIEEAYEEFEKFQIPLIADKVGVYHSEALIIPMLVYQNLVKIKEELLFASKLFNVTCGYDTAIRIAISSDLGKYINKQILISSITKEYNRYFIIDGRVSDKTDILIWDSNTDSVKYRNAMLVNKRYDYDKIDIVSVENIHKAIDKKIAVNK